MSIFQSRNAVLKASIPDGRQTAVVGQNPSMDTFNDLSVKDMRALAQGTLRLLTRENRDLVRRMFPQTRGPFWTTRHHEVRRLAEDDGPVGKRFRETMWAAASRRGISALKGLILNPDQSLPTPHQLFDNLLALGEVRLPPPELLPREKLLSIKDPQRLIDIAEQLWAYTGFEGIAGDRSYRDVEDPADATKAMYHGNRSRAGVDVRSRVAWSRTAQATLVARTPVVLSNMEAASDLESCRIAAKAGITPFLFSMSDSERLKAAHEMKGDIFITVRTKPGEIALAKRLLDAGANIHIELANCHNPDGLAALIELRQYIDAKLGKEYSEPRFLSIGKAVRGPFYIACALAGADVVITNRGGSPICLTPEVTGRGVRTWSSVYEISLAQRLLFVLCELDVPILADAGLKSGGDISRAMTAGAEGGMIGTGMVRTMDSPPEKILFNGRWYTLNFGDASAHANPGKVGVAPQGHAAWWAIPTGRDGNPRTMETYCDELVTDMKGSIADSWADSAFQLPIYSRSGHIRVLGPKAFEEAAGRTGSTPDVALAEKRRASRLARDHKKD